MNKLIVLLLCVFLCILSWHIPKVNPFLFRSETILVQSSEISVDYEIKSDLSISWKYKQPESSIFLNTKDMFIEFERITMDNKSTRFITSTFHGFSTKLRPEDVIQSLIVAYPQNLKYIHVLITKYNDNWTEKADAYYLITTYKDGRKSHAVFKVNNDTEIIHNEDGKLDLNSGGLYLEEMHLREILINGNSHDGFTLLVTPESRSVFKVKEGSVRQYQR